MIKQIRVAWHTARALSDLESAVIVLTGGLGAGKTFSLWVKHLSLCAVNSESELSAIFEPIYSKIIDTVIPTGRKVLNMMGFVENVHYKFTTSQPSPKCVLLASGQEIHLRSAENPETIVAVEYSHVSGDELAIWKEDAYRNCRSRIRCPRAKVHQFIGATAPQGVNWAADEFDSDSQEGWTYTEERDAFHPGKRIRRLTMWTDENPYIPAGYLRSLREIYGHNPNLIQSYRYGMFCPLVSGSAYANYSPQRHDIPDKDADPFRELVLSWDFNAHPIAWVAAQRLPYQVGLETRFRYIVLDEANFDSSNLDEAVAEFAVKFPPERYRETVIGVYGDRTGHAASHKVRGSDYENIERLLRQCGYRRIDTRASRQVAPEAASVEAVNRLFREDLLFVCKNAKNLRRSLMATTWRKNERKIEKPVGETWTHHGDALKYWAYQETRDETGTSARKILGINF